MSRTAKLYLKPKCQKNYRGEHDAEYIRYRKDDYVCECPECGCALIPVYPRNSTSYYRCLSSIGHAAGCSRDRSGTGEGGTTNVIEIENLGAPCLDFFGLDKADFIVKKDIDRGNPDKPKEKGGKTKKRKKIKTYNMDPKLIANLETIYNDVLFEFSKEDVIEVRTDDNKYESKKIKDILIDSETATEYFKGNLKSEGKKIVICQKCRPSAIGMEKLPENTLLFRDTTENYKGKAMFFLVHFEKESLFWQISKEIFSKVKHIEDNIVEYGDWEEVSSVSEYKLIATQVRSQTCIFWVEK